VGPISRRYNCQPCGEKALADQIRGNAGEPGPARDRYLAGLIDYVASLYGYSQVPDQLVRELAGVESDAGELIGA
jgi:hypothetical protein